jgi:hypothetical protein
MTQRLWTFYLVGLRLAVGSPAQCGDDDEEVKKRQAVQDFGRTVKEFGGNTSSNGHFGPIHVDNWNSSSGTLRDAANSGSGTYAHEGTTYSWNSSSNDGSKWG